MTRFEVEDIFSKVLEKTPKFCTTLESEYAINWREQKIMFYGKYYWKYEIFDKDGNEIPLIKDINDFANNSEQIKTKDNCDAIVISWIDDEQNEPELKIGLRDSEILNIEKIKDYLLNSKEKLLENYYEYWKDFQKMYQWNMKALEHVNRLRKKLDEYQSAAMEPDMNIVSYIRKKINEEMDKFDQEYISIFHKK